MTTIPLGTSLNAIRSFEIDPDRRGFRLDPRDPTFFPDPYPVYAALHAEAPVAFWHEANCIAVVSHPIVERILKSRDFGRVLPVNGTGRPARDAIPERLVNFYALEEHSLLDLEAPAHTRLRALLTRAFVSRQIEALAPTIRTLAHGLIDRFDPNGPVDLVKAFAEPLPVAVIARLIGVPAEDADDLLRWSHAMVAMYQMGRDEAVERRAEAAAIEFADYLKMHLAAKRTRPASDLISALLVAETKDGRLSEAELVSLIVLLLNAGHEATVHQIGNAMAAVLGQGIPLAPLAAGSAIAEQFVEEALRFDTPLHLFKRVALVDTDIGDFTVRAGQEVALMLAAANHDPEIFPAPETFQVHRARNPHVSFGAGTHFCIGAPLARLELRLAFQALAERHPEMRLASLPEYRDSYHFRGVGSLMVHQYG